jgi:hypothetical protein
MGQRRRLPVSVAGRMGFDPGIQSAMKARAWRARARRATKVALVPGPSDRPVVSVRRGEARLELYVGSGGWFTLSQVVAQAVAAPREEGPTLGRPLVDRLKATKIHHLKELWPGSKGRSEIRIIFAFDPTRSALLLLGGDKAGNWARWYRATSR